VIDAGDFHGVVDVVDNFGPVDAREFAGFYIFAGDAVTFDELAAFFVAATLLDFERNGLIDLWIGAFGVAEILLRKPTWKLIWMTPPLAASSRIIVSDMLRG
jgi:hypothetical protein